MTVRHDPTHDPLFDYKDCWVCRQVLTTVWVSLAPELQDVSIDHIIPLLRSRLVELV